VRFFVGITDRTWYEYLSQQDGIDEVNFWQPSGRSAIRVGR
jgi:putative restriction endonuclease